MDNSWMNDPKMSNIDKSKLLLLNELASQSSAKTAKDMMPMLVNAMNKAKQKGVQFTSDEIDIIINVMKKDMSPEEKQRVDKIRQLVSMMNR